MATISEWLKENNPDLYESLLEDGNLEEGDMDIDIESEDGKALLEAFGAINNMFEHIANIPVPDELTVEIIDKTSDDDLAYMVFESLCKKIPDYTKEYDTVLGFNKVHQALYILFQFDGEVRNGGFPQYYGNTEGQFAKFLPELLEFIGEHEFSDLAKRAHAVVEDAYRKTSLDFKSFVDSYDFGNTAFEKLDSEYYALGEKRPLWEILARFIRENKTEFII
jgi:hypothetical protein